MRKIALFFLSLSITMALLQAVDVPELDRLREAHKTALERAAKPVTQTYLAELAKLRDAYTRAANLEAANRVQTEIRAISQNATADDVGQAVSAPKGDILGTRVDIRANEMNGYKIGSLKRGATITLSYVDGKWKNDGVIASEVPDAEVTARGDTVRLAISTASVNGSPGTVIAVVPAGTASKPFTYKLDSDQESVVLRINESGNDYTSNPGQVTYKLKVTR
jgi:hypothetical protein